MESHHKNVVLTPGNPACNLCSYSGFSNVCMMMEKEEMCLQAESLTHLRHQSKIKKLLEIDSLAHLKQQPQLKEPMGVPLAV